jgi:UrcA family protein
MAVSSFVKVAAAALTSLVAISATPAFAQDIDQKSREVRFADLDLTKDADVAALEQRVKRATRRVCGNAESRALNDMLDMMACRETAMTSARSSMNLAIAAARTGERYAGGGAASTLSVSAP